MDASRLIERLGAFASGLPALVAAVSEEQGRWRPPSGAWSILEIVCHLVDEEVRDFRTRVEMTLRDPASAWPAIHPSDWAINERYNERVLSESVRRFVEERRASIAWLRSLKDPDWGRAYMHPKAGRLSAGMLLGSWAAHDALHIRQIAKRLYELAGRDCGESVGYAGDWTA